MKPLTEVLLFILSISGNWFWKAQLVRRVILAWASWPTTAPLWVAESQVTACASWVLLRAFGSKKGLNLVVERFQSGINFIILGSERRWWTRLVSPVEVSIKTKVITTTAYARRPGRARGTRRTLQRRKWERGGFVFGYTETSMTAGFQMGITQKHVLISKKRIKFM